MLIRRLDLVAVSLQGFEIQNGQVFSTGADSSIFLPVLNVSTHDDPSGPNHPRQDFMGQIMNQQKRLNCEGLIADPGVAVVQLRSPPISWGRLPVGVATNTWFIGQKPKHEWRAVYYVLPAARVSALGDPVVPIRHSVAKRGFGLVHATTIVRPKLTRYEDGALPFTQSELVDYTSAVSSQRRFGGQADLQCPRMESSGVVDDRRHVRIAHKIERRPASMRKSNYLLRGNLSWYRYDGGGNSFWCQC